MFKQAKTAWRLIAFRSDIYTVVSIFKTCRENRELSNEEPLWKRLCRRDFRHGDSKNDYVCKHIFGSLVIFSNYIAESRLILGRGTPMYFFGDGNHWLVTVREKARMSFPIPLTPIMKKHGRVYTFNPETKTVTSDKEILHPINMNRMMDWMLRHFEVEVLTFEYNHVKFKGEILPGFRNARWGYLDPSYYLHFSGRLELTTSNIAHTRLPLEIYDNGVKIEIPNFTQSSSSLESQAQCL